MADLRIVVPRELLPDFRRTLIGIREALLDAIAREWVAGYAVELSDVDRVLEQLRRHSDGSAATEIFGHPELLGDVLLPLVLDAVERFEASLRDWHAGIQSTPHEVLQALLAIYSLLEEVLGPEQSG